MTMEKLMLEETVNIIYPKKKNRVYIISEIMKGIKVETGVIWCLVPTLNSSEWSKNWLTFKAKDVRKVKKRLLVHI